MNLANYHYMHLNVSKWPNMLLTPGKLLILTLLGFWSCSALPDPEGAQRLTTEEILSAFSDVVDSAEVQDSRGTTALNYWYADGRFTLISG